MKRFIIISMIAALTLPASACLWIENYNSYLFSPYDNEEFSYRVDRVTVDNWKAYVGSTDTYYYFNADEVMDFARKKGDALMVSYILNLQKYLKCADEKRYEQWNYPSKEELAARRQTLQAVRTYAQGKLKSRLRSQHALLYMRCNMMLGQHADNVTFWVTTGSGLIESVYRDMMRNIYAGALYNTGSEEAAAQIFAEQGDWNSLMTMYYKRRSYQAIRQEYLDNPTSAVMPFLLKDFVNNAQEAVDGTNTEDAIGGKLFIRNITKAEAMQMCQLARLVVSEGKTTTPVLWQSAKAWLEFMFGDHQQGLKDIEAAMTMEGTERMKDNARVLKLYMTAVTSKADAAFDDYLAGELQWLEEKSNNEGFFMSARDRLMHQVLVDKYSSQPDRSLAMQKATGCTTYIDYIDTMRVEGVLRFLDYVNSPAQNKLDRFLKERQKNEMDEMNDLVGTKYMRLCQWEKAEAWLQKVPLEFYNNRGYCGYAALRHWNVEPWIKRQWLSDDIGYGENKPVLKANPKLSFAREMLRMEAELALLKGQARQQQCYDLAVRYAQAHYTGDCWFLMRDLKSFGDTLRVNETDLAAKAMTLLREASQTKDFKLKEHALFAMSYVYLNPTAWYTEVWDSETFETYRKPNSKGTQYQAFAALSDFEKANATRTSQYVSRCDEYIQFRKVYK